MSAPLASQPASAGTGDRLMLQRQGRNPTEFNGAADHRKMEALNKASGEVSRHQSHAGVKPRERERKRERERG